MAKPIPVKRRQFLDSFVDPYIKEIGNPNINIPKNTPPGEPEFNRAFEISLKGDTDKIPKIGIKDIDEAILFYFQERLKLSVIQNNTQLLVPIIYASPERWKAVQADGYYRDAQGRVMSPLFLYKKETIESDRTLGNKLDGNSVSNLIMFKKKFSRRNIYDNFYINTNQKPQEEWMLAIVPDYVTVTYSCVIFTDFVEQMNKLIEALNFASHSYWGDPQKFQFRSKIESFTTQVLLEQDVDRAVKTTFNIILNGYLIPDTINAEIAKLSNKVHNFTKVIFNPETVISNF